MSPFTLINADSAAMATTTTPDSHAVRPVAVPKKKPSAPAVITYPMRRARYQ